MELVLPFAFVALGLGSALMIVLRKEPMQGALFLVFTLFTVAASYLFLGAEFLAAVQIIVYAGAIMVLIAFVIQLTGTHSDDQRILHRQAALAISAVSAFFCLLIIVTVRAVRTFSADGRAAEEMGQSFSFSRELFTTYVFPFEVASVLLLVAIFGTVLLAQRRGIRE